MSKTPEPEIYSITEQSNSNVWASLQPPEVRLKALETEVSELIDTYLENGDNADFKIQLEQLAIALGKV